MTLRRMEMDTTRRSRLLHCQVERIAAQRIYRDLIARSGTMPLHSPDTWRIVALGLDIFTEPWLPKYRRATGDLRYDWYYDVWTIRYNVMLDDIGTARVLIHELAEWYQRRFDTIWFLPFAYYYEGDVILSRHRIARRVERMILNEFYRRTYV